MLAGCVHVSPDRLSATESDALAAYRSAGLVLLARERTGVRAFVTLEYPDGTKGEGVDEYINGTPVRLREVRRDYEAVAVGDTLCVRRDSEPMECSQNEIYLGIREIDEQAVRRAVSSMAACGSSVCRQIDIEQDSIDIAALFEGAHKAPRTLRYELRLLIRDDGLPYSITESRWSGSELVEPLSNFRFDYEADVGPIELPPEASDGWKSGSECLFFKTGVRVEFARNPNRKEVDSDPSSRCREATLA